MRRLSYERAINIVSERKDFLVLACTPHDEVCQPAGENIKDQIIDCVALKNQLLRIYPDIPEEAKYFILQNNHEFGTYYELGIFYRPTTQEEEDADNESPSELYALKCEMGIPDKWDALAIEELTKEGHCSFTKTPAKIAVHQGRVVNIKSKSA